MKKQKSSLKKTLVTNACLAVIIILVYIATFAPLGGMVKSTTPALKGNTGENVVGLQIIVENSTDIGAYLEVLDRYDIKATFFFEEQEPDAQTPLLQEVMKWGHGVGYYITEKTRTSALYIGGGFSIPVMSYAEGEVLREVCPSIDISKMFQSGDWAASLADVLTGDMFICIHADNNFDEFEKVVQIVLDKGYTILKVNEML